MLHGKNGSKVGKSKMNGKAMSKMSVKMESGKVHTSRMKGMGMK